MSIFGILTIQMTDIGSLIRPPVKNDPSRIRASFQPLFFPILHLTFVCGRSVSPFARNHRPRNTAQIVAFFQYLKTILAHQRGDVP